MEGTFDIAKACVGWMWSITHACCKCAVGMGCLKWMTTSMSLQWFVCLGTFMLIQACSQVMSVQSICLCTFLSHCRCRVKEPKAKVGWWPLYFALGWAWRLGQGGGRGWGKQFLCTQRWWNRCGREWGTWIVSGWGVWCQWCVCLEILFPKTSKRWLTKSHCWTLVLFCLLLQWKSVLYLYTQFVDGNFCLLILRAVTECWSPSKINFLSKWFSLLI